MRRDFVADQTKAAKRKGKELAKTYSFWYRRKYNLSPADPVFLDLTPEDIETEYWAHHYYEAGDKEEFEDDDFDIDAYVSEIEAESSDDDWETVIDE